MQLQRRGHFNDSEANMRGRRRCSFFSSVVPSIRWSSSFHDSFLLCLMFLLVQLFCLAAVCDAQNTTTTATTGPPITTTTAAPTTSPTTLSPNTTVSPNAADGTEVESVDFTVIILGGFLVFGLLIGSCYVTLMWQQKALRQYKATYEAILKARGDDRRAVQNRILQGEHIPFNEERYAQAQKKDGDEEVGGGGAEDGDDDGGGNTASRWEADPFMSPVALRARILGQVFSPPTFTQKEQPGLLELNNDTRAWHAVKTGPVYAQPPTRAHTEQQAQRLERYLAEEGHQDFVTATQRASRTLDRSALHEEGLLRGDDDHSPNTTTTDEGSMMMATTRAVRMGDVGVVGGGRMWRAGEDGVVEAGRHARPTSPSHHHHHVELEEVTPQSVLRRSLAVEQAVSALRASSQLKHLSSLL